MYLCAAMQLLSVKVQRGNAEMYRRSSYKRVKGGSHTVEERISMHSHRPHAKLVVAKEVRWDSG